MHSQLRSPPPHHRLPFLPPPLPSQNHTCDVHVPAGRRCSARQAGLRGHVFIPQAGRRCERSGRGRVSACCWGSKRGTNAACSFHKPVGVVSGQANERRAPRHPVSGFQGFKAKPSNLHAKWERDGRLRHTAGCSRVEVCTVTLQLCFTVMFCEYIVGCARTLCSYTASAAATSQRLETQR
eukprot:364802-Chlamydomonas_euryale.AAC.1